MLQAADTLDGGQGTDKAEFILTGNESVRASNVEQFYLQAVSGTPTFNMGSVEDAEQVWSDESASALTVSNLQNNATLGLDNTTVNYTASFASDAVGADETLSVAAIDSTTVDLDVTHGGGDSKFTTLAFAATGTNSIDVLGSAGSGGDNGDATTLSTSGTGSITLVAGGSAFDNLTTITLGAESGSDVDLGSNAKDVTVTGSDADETVTFAASQLTDKDSIDLGDGTDKLFVGDSNLNQASTAALTKAVNAASGVEVLGTDTTSATTIGADKYADINDFEVNTTAISLSEATDGASSGANGDSGADAIAVVGSTDATTLTLVDSAGSTETLDIVGAAGGSGSADATGGSTGGDGGDGGDGLSLTPETDGGSNAFTLKLGSASVDLKGGAGGAGAEGTGSGDDGDGGDGGDALNASIIETLNIITDGDLVVSGGGAGGASGGGSGGTDGTNGGETVVGANATINLEGAGKADLGTVSTNTNSNNFTINAADLEDKLTVTTGSGNDTITGGAGDDDITASTGTNSLTGNGGVDKFNFADSSSTVSAITTITDFEVGQGGDVLNFTTDAGTYEELTASNETEIEADTSLSDAFTQALSQLSAHEVTAFAYDGDGYVAYESGGAGDVIVKLAGVTDFSSFDDAQVT